MGISTKCVFQFEKMILNYDLNNHLFYMLNCTDFFFSNKYKNYFL